MYGQFLRRVRESRGLTQAELSEISGVSQPNISAFENDRRTPTIDTLNRLLVACGYELAAVAGRRMIVAPLPRAGWFPDETLPLPLPDDPPDERSVIGPNSSLEDRVKAITAVLEASLP
ncbi:MAG: helix-turn-helix domain-containing protein [Acidimicrobiales bacterium]|nr:helix-turn-helix domain-containing protein [Acidimicrobiales bacterium]